LFGALDRNCSFNQWTHFHPVAAHSIIMEKKKLNHYNVFEVIDTFDIRKNRDCQILKDWLQVDGAFTDFESQLMETARQRLELKWDEWNEQELKMNFISFVFFVAQTDEPEKISTFYERKVAGKVNDIAISLVIDCMLASPTNSGLPKSPYFFLQEFKRSLGNNHDPEGQMLAAMILAQEKNQNSQPLFGSWIQGRFWYFTTLVRNHYCVSNPYNATNPDDLLQIVFILRKLKALILNR
jgi:hypothetical protein